MHPVNIRTPSKRNCVLCKRFERMVSTETILCDRFGNTFPAVETECAFWEREPGGDDEADAGFWRDVMHRRFPPRIQPRQLPRTLEATRAIMGENYVPGSLNVGKPVAPVDPPRVVDAIDRDEEAEAVRQALGPAADF